MLCDRFERGANLIVRLALMLERSRSLSYARGEHIRRTATQAVTEMRIHVFLCLQGSQCMKDVADKEILCFILYDKLLYGNKNGVIAI